MMKRITTTRKVAKIIQTLLLKHKELTIKQLVGMTGYHGGEICKALEFDNSFIVNLQHGDTQPITQIFKNKEITEGAIVKWKKN